MKTKILDYNQDKITIMKVMIISQKVKALKKKSLNQVKSLPNSNCKEMKKIKKKEVNKKLLILI